MAPLRPAYIDIYDFSSRFSGKCSQWFITVVLKVGVRGHPRVLEEKRKYVFTPFLSISNVKTKCMTVFGHEFHTLSVVKHLKTKLLLDDGLWDAFTVDSGVLDICVPLIYTIYNYWAQVLSSIVSVFVFTHYAVLANSGCKLEANTLKKSFYNMYFAAALHLPSVFLKKILTYGGKSPPQPHKNDLGGSEHK